jgi:hypothetical protein
MPVNLDEGSAPDDADLCGVGYGAAEVWHDREWFERLRPGGLLRTTDEGDVVLTHCPFCYLNFSAVADAPTDIRIRHFRRCPVYHDDEDECPVTGLNFADLGVDPREFYTSRDCPAYHSNAS